MIDVDHFKNFNDHYGHASGDDCLRRVSQSLKQELVRPGDLIARYGGEEFMVILPETDASGASTVAAALVQAVNDLAIDHAYSTAGDHVTISAGVATTIPNVSCTSALQLLEAADAMMYQAKHNGRNQFLVKEFTPP